MEAPAALVRAHREPLRVRHRLPASGMGASSTEERIMAGNMVGQVAQVYIDLRKILEELEPSLNQMGKAYGDFRKTLAQVGTAAFLRKGIPLGPGMAIEATLRSVTAVTEAVRASQKEGVDYRKAHDAILAIADSVNQTSAAEYAFRKITLPDLVGIGVITAAQAADVAERAGYDSQTAKYATLDGVADGWAKKSGSTIPAGWIRIRWEEFRDARTRIEGKILALAAQMNISGEISFDDDEKLAEAIKEKLLAEMKKAYDDVMARRKPEGWLSAAFNRAVEIAANQPWLLIFGVAGIVFGHFMGPILKLDMGLTRASFAASRLVEASTKIAAAGVETYARVYKESRVDGGKTDKEAQAAATKALEETVAMVGKQEYTAAAEEIDNYRNYAKAVKVAFQDFLGGLLGWLKWIAIGAGVVLVGGVVLSRSMRPTQRIEVVVRR